MITWNPDIEGLSEWGAFKKAENIPHVCELPLTVRRGDGAVVC